MSSTLILAIIVCVYLIRIFFYRVRGKSIKSLFLSFFLFCIPFEIGKNLGVNMGQFAGTLGVNFNLTIPVLLSFVLLPLFIVRGKLYFQERPSLKNWVVVVIVFILVSLVNPFNESVSATVIYATFFLSNIIVCRYFYINLSKQEVFAAFFDAFSLLCILQFFLALCFPVLGLKNVTGLFHEISAETATRHASDRVGAVGTFKHPGGLALYTLIASSFFLATNLICHRKRLSQILLLANTVTLVLTFSRTSYLAYVVVLFACYYLFKNARRNLFTLTNVMKFIVPVSLFVIWLVYFSPLSSTFLKSDASEQYENRMIHWIMGMSIFQYSPVIGVGLNSHLSYLGNHFQILNTLTDSDFFAENPIHNIHLIILSETGAIGFLLWIYFLIKNILSSKNQIAVRQNEVFSLTLIGLLLAFVIYGMTGWSPFSPGIFPFFLFICYFSIKYRSLAETDGKYELSLSAIPRLA